mmetsp:Transcript_36277/g.93538  ORF Transcript_36277/g.93538 Transcript_36277/m.93538 type:complete len:146 (+) Transcript_36277:66-503(+)
MARAAVAFALLLLGSLATARAERSALTTGTRIHDRDLDLRAEMRRMMADDAEELPGAGTDARRGSFLQVRGLRGRAARAAGQVQVGSMDDYLREAESGLSAALGPRWDARKLEQDADMKTQALLRGISGPRALHAITSLMGGVGR